MKKTLLLLCLMLALALCACGAPTEEEAAEEPAVEEEAVEEEAAEEEAAPADASGITFTADEITPAESPYSVEINDAMMLTNYEGDELLTVFYTWTNNSEETLSAFVALDITAFQDGIELDTGYIDKDALPADRASLYDNDWKDIQPGASLQCYESFVAPSASDVQIIVKEFLGEDAPLAQGTLSFAQ